MYKKLSIWIFVLFSFVAIVSAINETKLDIINSEIISFNQTYIGSINGSLGILEGALEFDEETGVNTYLHPKNPINFTLGFGLSMWLNTETVAHYNPPFYSYGGGSFWIRTPNQVVKKWEVWLQDESGDSFAKMYSVDPIPSGVWQHLALTYNDSSKVATLYVDGVQDNTTTVIGKFIENDPEEYGYFRLGGSFNGGYTYDGKIDEVLITREPFTSDEVTSLYQSGSPTQQANEIITEGILYYSNMDELSDLSISNYHATQYGNITLTNNTPANKPWIKSSFDLDGVNDYLDVSDVLTSLQETDTGTICTWHRPEGDGYETLFMGSDNNAQGYISLWFVSGKYTATGFSSGSVIQWQPRTNNTFSNNEYHFVCFVHNSSSSKIYVDGVDEPVTQLNFVTHDFWFDDETNFDVFNIGRYYTSGSANHYHKGEIMHFIIYNRSLTSTEILSLYNTGDIEGGEVPSYSDEFPSDGATNVLTNINLSITVYDPDDDTMQVNITFNNSIACSQDDVANGTTVYCDIPDLGYYTTYYWNATLDDGSGTNTTDTFSFTTTPTYPVIDFINQSPLNNSNTTTDIPMYFNITYVSSTADCYIYVNGTNVLNQTSLGVDLHNFTYLLSWGSQGLNEVTVTCEDSTNSTFNTSQWKYIFVDSIAPAIDFAYIVNDSNGANFDINGSQIFENLNFNISVSDANDISSFNITVGSVYFDSYAPGTDTYNYVNTSPITDYEISYYNFTYESCDIYGNCMQRTDTALVNNSYPYIIIFSPDSELYATNEIPINFTAVDGNLDRLWFFNGTDNQTYTNELNITLDDGLYTLYFYANDTLDNQNQSEYTFRIDTTLPNITIVYPESTNYSYLLTELNYTTDSVEYCWFSSDYGITSSGHVTAGENFTNLTSSTTSVEGLNNWTVYCNNSFGSVTNDTVQFYSDITAPSLTINDPMPGYYKTDNISIDITSSDNILSVSRTWYDNSTENITYTGPTSYILDEGVYNYYFYANDTVGYLNSTNVTFIIDLTTPYLVVHSPEPINYTNNSILLNITASDTYLDTITYYNGTTNNTYTTETIINVPDGNHEFIFYANDSAGNVNQTTVNFTVDATAPSVTIESPLNQSYGYANILINITSVDGYIGVDRIWYEYNDTNVSYTTEVYRAFVEGPHFLKAYSNDTFGNIGMDEVYFFVNTTTPDISITYPLETNYSYSQHDLNYTTTADDKCWYNNGTVNSSTVNAGDSFIAENATEGSNTWTVYCNNSLSVTGSTSVTFVVDTISPAIVVHSPEQNQTYSNSSVLINITTTDATSTNIWYFNGTDNQTYSSETYINLSDGDHYIIVYANDSAGNFNQTTVNFSIDTIIPTITLYSPAEDNSTVETNVTPINFNISFYDSNLFAYNVTCVNETGHIEYSNQTVDLNVTTFNFYDNQIFGNPGTKYCTATVADDHTANKFTPVIKIKQPVFGIGNNRIELNNGELIFEYDERNKNRLESLTYSVKSDRVSPIINLKNPKSIEDKDKKYVEIFWTIHFKGDSYMRDKRTGIPGHTVVLPDGKLTEGYWYDAESQYDAENAEITYQKEKNKIMYRMRVHEKKLKENDNTIITRSIGGLNIYNKSFEFEIVSGQQVNFSGYDMITGSTVPVNISLKNGSVWVNFTINTSLSLDLVCGQNYEVYINNSAYMNEYYNSFTGCQYENLTAGFYYSRAAITTKNAISLTGVTNITINMTQNNSENYSFEFTNTRNPTYIALYPGNYTINASGMGYVDANYTFEIIFGETLTVTIDMIPTYTTNFYREQNGYEFNFVESTAPYACANGTVIISNYTTQYVPNTYACSDGWDATNECENAVDGLSETYGISNSTSSASVNFTFNKPTEATNISQFIIRKDVIRSEIINMTEFPGCFAQNPLRFMAISNSSGSTLDMYCYNGTVYESMQSFNNGGTLYRAYMRWGYQENITYYEICDNETQMYVDVEVYCPDTVLSYKINNTDREVTGVNCRYDYWLIRPVYSTATYYRTLIPDYAEIITDIYLLDLNLDEAIEVILRVNDIANQYGDGQVKIYKYINGSREIVIQQLLDIELRAVLWLDKYETYEVCTINNDGVEICHGDLVADQAGEKIITLPKMDFVGTSTNAGEDIWWTYTGSKETGLAKLTYIDHTENGYNTLTWTIKDKAGATVSNEVRLNGASTNITVTGLNREKTYFTYLTIDHKDVQIEREIKPLWFKSYTTFPGFSVPQGDTMKLLIGILAPLFMLVIFSTATIEIGMLVTMVLIYVLNQAGFYDILTFGGAINKTWIDVIIILSSMMVFWMWLRKARKTQ